MIHLNDEPRRDAYWDGMSANLFQRESLIAVIDDDPAVLESIEFLLAVQGHEVLAYPSAEKALGDRRIADATFLIVDWKLPKMDGLNLLARLRERHVTAPAILLASMPPSRCRRLAAELGAPVVEKPLTGEAIGKWLTWLPPAQGRGVSRLRAGEREADHEKPAEDFVRPR